MKNDCLTELDRLAFDSLIDDLKQSDLGYEIDVNGKDYLIKLPEKASFNWDNHSIDQIESSSVLPAWFIKFALYLESNDLTQSDKTVLGILLSKTVEFLIDETNESIEETFLSKDLMQDRFIEGLSVTVDLDGAFQFIIDSDPDYFKVLERIAKRSGVFDESFFEISDDFPKLFGYALKQTLIDQFVKVVEDREDQYLVKGVKKDGVDWFTQAELIVEQDNRR